MSRERRRYSKEFKLAAVRQMETCGNITGLAQEMGIRRKFLYQWRKQFQLLGEVGMERGPGRPPGPRPKSGAVKREAGQSAQEKRIAELERQLGVKQLEVDFFKRTFEHVRGATATRTGDGGTGSTVSSKPHSRSKEQD